MLFAVVILGVGEAGGVLPGAEVGGVLPGAEVGGGVFCEVGSGEVGEASVLLAGCVVADSFLFIKSVTKRLTGPERIEYVLVNTLSTSMLELLELPHRSGHVSEDLVAMHRLSLHSTYIIVSEAVLLFKSRR